MSAERRTALTWSLAILVLSSTLGAAVPVGAAQPSGQTIAGTQVSPDDILLRIDVAANGSATWAVEYRIRLDDQNSTQAFQSIRTDVQNNESAFAAPFEGRMRATAGDAENTTGREMAVRNVSVTTSRQRIPEEYGVVTYRFEWEGFAVRSGDQLRVGDAIAGLFLDESTTLVLTWPPGYSIDSVEPTPDRRESGSVTWSGPVDFTDREPSLVLTTAPGGGSGGDGPLGTGLLVGLGVVVLVGGAAVLMYRRKRPTLPSIGDRTTSDSGETDSEETATAESTEPAPPPELLSNEERVLRLVRERGGRIKQQEVAETLDWTDAKTSQVVRKMRDEGDLEAFRLGRENVLRLPEDADESTDE
jgi:hypothetical protein